jgi:hypothetical protein
LTACGAATYFPLIANINLIAGLQHCCEQWVLMKSLVLSCLKSRKSRGKNHYTLHSEQSRHGQMTRNCLRWCVYSETCQQQNCKRQKFFAFQACSVLYTNLKFESSGAHSPHADSRNYATAASFEIPSNLLFTNQFSPDSPHLRPRRSKLHSSTLCSRTDSVNARK